MQRQVAVPAADVEHVAVRADGGVEQIEECILSVAGGNC